MTFIVDTHPLVWLLAGDARLSGRAREIFAQEAAQLVVPAIVLAEISYLYGRSRIKVDVRDALDHIVAARNCAVYPLDEAVVQHLPTSLNIHDGIIVATAMVFRDIMDQKVAVVTKDTQISASGIIDVVW